MIPVRVEPKRRKRAPMAAEYARDPIRKLLQLFGRFLLFSRRLVAVAVRMHTSSRFRGCKHSCGAYDCATRR